VITTLRIVSELPLDQECALWDWARTAGLSASELRAWLAAAEGEALNESISAGDPP